MGHAMAGICGLLAVINVYCLRACDSSVVSINVSPHPVPILDHFYVARADIPR